MNRIRIWPHGALIVLAFAVIAAIGAALWLRYERTAQAKDLPNAARLDRVHGQVGVNHSLDNSASKDWVQATQNTPVSVGDRIYTRDNSGAEIAFTGRNFATLHDDTSLDVLELSSQRTQVALREGSALIDVGSLASGQLFEVATPCGAVDLQEAGVYRVAIDDNGNASLTALSGRAQLIGQGGSGVIEKGETMTVPCQGGSGVLSSVDAGQAGELLDNYYRARYPRRYDGRYRNYYTYLDDPYYYDPYRQYPSYNYVSEYVPGIDDLDYYGDWQYVSDYGYAWRPRVNSGWAPYQSGYWTMDYPYGLTWVSTEPWGYAPYHYGRWAYFGNQWYWVPEATRTYPTYSPALVAFLPFDQSSVAWVPLGPSDPYSSWYYDQNWQPVYYSQPTVIEQRIVNISVPGAVTVVPVQEFSRVIDPGVVARVDPQVFARTRPVLDPLKVDPLRRAAFKTREAHQKFDVPQAVAQRINNTPVITSTSPSAPRFRRDLARSLNVESVPDRVRNQKIQFRDEREATARSQQKDAATNRQQQNLAAEQARARQMLDLARQASRGDRNARQQMQVLRRQQVEQQRGERFSAQQAQGERVRQQMQQQSQRDAWRQQQQAQRAAAQEQMITRQQERRAAAQQQIQTQREQRRQFEFPRAQQPAVRHSQPQQQIRLQAPAQQRERRQQPQYRPPQVQQRVFSPPPQRAQPQPQRVQHQIRQAQPRVERPQMQRAQPQPQSVAQPAQPRTQPQAAQQPKHAEQSQAKGGGRKKP